MTLLIARQVIRIFNLKEGKVFSWSVTRAARPSFASVRPSVRLGLLACLSDWARGTLLEMADAIGNGRDAVKRASIDALLPPSRLSYFLLCRFYLFS